MPKLLIQGPHCEGQSHTARKAAPICQGRARDQDPEIRSKEGMRTKLTRGLRRVEPQGTTEAQLSCRQWKHRGNESYVEDTPRTEEHPWPLILFQKLQENLPASADRDRKPQILIKKIPGTGSGRQLVVTYKIPPTPPPPPCPFQGKCHQKQGCIFWVRPKVIKRQQMCS